MANRNIQFSYLEAFFSSLMLGAGEAFFAAYALSKGMGEVTAGLVVGLPLMLGACLQTATPALFNWFARPKRWVMLTATLQALTLFALMLTTVSMTAGPITVFLLIGFYWAFHYAGSTVWNYWMGLLIPGAERSEFFATRLRLIQYGIVVGLLLAGFFLHFGEARGLGAKAYLLPFLIAFLSRCLAVYLMGAQSPVRYEQVKSELSLNVVRFFKETLEVFRQNPQARKDLTFLFVFNCAIYISSAFVTPFLLAKLRFDYLSFMATQMALYLGKIFALFLAKRLIEKYGVRLVLFWGALGMSPLPALWVIVDRTLEAVALQLASGFFWGLFEVAMGLVVFAEFPHRDKVKLLTWNNFFVTTAILIGTVLGAQMLALQNESIFGYFLIFSVGALLRVVLVIGSTRPRSLSRSRSMLS